MNMNPKTNIYDMIQQQFETKCDNIQSETDKLLNMVPKYDIKRRKKILDLHKLKLKEALFKLNENLKSL
ncbi:hypothetical protein J7J83_02315 [bacterium]|nr:hypothetical protein [bacterium]